MAVRKDARAFKLGEILLFTRQISPQQLQHALSLQVQRVEESRRDSLQLYKRSQTVPKARRDEDEEVSWVGKLFSKIAGK